MLRVGVMPRRVKKAMAAELSRYRMVATEVTSGWSCWTLRRFLEDELAGDDSRPRTATDHQLVEHETRAAKIRTLESERSPLSVAGDGSMPGWVTRTCFQVEPLVPAHLFPGQVRIAAEPGRGRESQQRHQLLPPSALEGRELKAWQPLGSRHHLREDACVRFGRPQVERIRPWGPHRRPVGNEGKPVLAGGRNDFVGGWRPVVANVKCPDPRCQDPGVERAFLDAIHLPARS